MSLESTSAKDSEPLIPIAEMRRVATAIEDKTWFLALFAAWALVFHFIGNSTFGFIASPSIFTWMHSAYSAPESDDSHGLLIPFIVALVLWWRRDQLLALPRRSWGPGLGLLLLAGLLHIFAYLIQQPRLSIAAFFAGVWALVGIVWGKSWLKAVFAPFCIFVFCVPVSTMSLITKLTVPLQVLASAISGWIAHSVLGFHVSSQGTSIIDDATGIVKYEVVRGCSGIRSLISLFALMTIFGIVAYRSPWRRLALALISIPLALICNIFRLDCIILAGEVFGHKASDFAHEYSGFFTYAIALACMGVLSHWWAEAPAAAGGTPNDE